MEFRLSCGRGDPSNKDSEKWKWKYRTKNSESENIIYEKEEIWHQSWKSWTGGDSLDNDYKVKVEMTQKVKVVQKMPPQKKQKGDEIVETNFN